MKAANESSYYLKLNGQVEGPFTIGQIYDLWAARKINSQTPFARYDAMENWQPLSDLTLKISAPKGAAPRLQPESESAASAQPKTKQPTPQLSEDQLPSLADYAPLLQPEPSRRDPPRPGGAERSTRSLGFFSWISVAAGLALTTGFVLFTSSTGESETRAAITKLTGVIAGVGLLGLGGLLAVARSMEQIAASFRIETKSVLETKDRRSS